MIFTVAIEAVRPATATTPQTEAILVQPENVCIAANNGNEAIARVAAKHAKEINECNDHLRVNCKATF